MHNLVNFCKMNRPEYHPDIDLSRDRSFRSAQEQSVTRLSEVPLCPVPAPHLSLPKGNHYFNF